MLDEQIEVIDIRDAQADLSQLHIKVVQNKDRIEIRCDGIEGTSVLISKEELECLERALEILSDTPGVRDICEKLKILAMGTFGAAFASV